MELTYHRGNLSFSRYVVYRIGLDAGFFSEYNNMILAMAWCLRNGVQFRLFSRNANFGFNKGWQDYFEPFCSENTSDYNLRYNHRPRPFGKSKYYPFVLRKLIQYGFIKANFDYIPLYSVILRSLNIGGLLTQDIFVKARSQDLDEFVELPDIDFRGTVRSLCKYLTDVTWRFNNDIQREIENLIETLRLPEIYLGFHIRYGDKYVEYDQIPVEDYIRKAMSLSEVKSAFVLTDDYRVLEKLRSSYPDWQFISLCQEHERGYFNDEFNKLNSDERKARYIRFFASMITLERAYRFIGTFSSNPGMFLGMRMPQEKCHGLDFDKWVIW